MSQTALQTAAYRAKYRAAGRCWLCPAKAMPGRTRCATHIEVARRWARQWRKAQKEARR